MFKRFIIGLSLIAISLSLTGAAEFPKQGQSFNTWGYDLRRFFGTFLDLTNGFAPTQGSIVFAGSNGYLSQDNTNLFWNSTNKILGIGTNTFTGVSVPALVFPNTRGVWGRKADGSGAVTLIRTDTLNAVIIGEGAGTTSIVTDVGSLKSNPRINWAGTGNGPNYTPIFAFELIEVTNPRIFKITYEQEGTPSTSRRDILTFDDEGRIGFRGYPTWNNVAIGEVVFNNNKYIRFANAGGTDTIKAIGIDASNRTVLGQDSGSDIVWSKPLVALGGGAAPTLGTIGGSGPTVAGQNSWMRVVDSTGAVFWVPVWK